MMLQIMILSGCLMRILLYILMFCGSSMLNADTTPVTTPSEQTQPTHYAPKIWNLRDADIRAVIAEISRVTGKNFLIDPRVQGKISIVSGSALSEKELYQVFLSMLQISGFSAVPNGNIIKVVPNSEAHTLSPDSLSQMKNPPRGDDMMVQVIPVQYTPAEQLVPVLRPLMPQWSTVSAFGPSNMLILSGRANNIKQLANIIKQVDNSSANGVDMVHLEYALAMDVASTLKELVKPTGGSQNQTMIAVDDRSNSILLSGNKTERLRLRLLIAQLDKKNSTSMSGNTQVIYLNYLRAEDLVPILAGIAQANFSGSVGTTIGSVTVPTLDSTNPAASIVTDSSSGQANQPINPAATPNTMAAATQNEGGTKPTVQIIAEPKTNSIIINAPMTLIRTLRSVINQLDIKPAQLLIEALVAEINESDFNTLGIEWGSVNQTTRATESFRPGFAIINSKTNIKDFQAQVYALARDHKANILSTPSVVVLDNRQAKILIGKQVSIANSTYPNNANGTAPSGSPFTTFNRVNVALHLYIRPQITRGQGIEMQIDQGNDTLEPTDEINGTTPIFNISAIVTSVHVESGDIIVLGGLTQDQVSSNSNYLPILGDIPGVGRLFQRNSVGHEKKVLMVFIRPHILRSENDVVQITGGKYNHMRQDQLDIGHAQEVYTPKINRTIAPPLHQSALPKPFCNTDKAAMKQ